MRYLGGKYRVARELSTLIHAHATYAKTTTTLYEPFMGGGNMSARLGNKYQHVHYSDIHGPLIARSGNMFSSPTTAPQTGYLTL